MHIKTVLITRIISGADRDIITRAHSLGAINDVMLEYIWHVRNLTGALSKRTMMPYIYKFYWAWLNVIVVPCNHPQNNTRIVILKGKILALIIFNDFQFFEKSLIFLITKDVFCMFFKRICEPQTKSRRLIFHKNSFCWKWFNFADISCSLIEVEYGVKRRLPGCFVWMGITPCVGASANKCGKWHTSLSK